MAPHPLLSRSDIGSEPWWNAVREAGTPLRQDLGDGRVALDFVWRQPRDADIGTVFIDVWSHTPHPVCGPTALHRLRATDVWHWRTELDANWNGSYFLMPVRVGQLPLPDERGALRDWWITQMERSAIADPFNPLPPHGRGDGGSLSAIRPPDARPLLPAAPPRGTLERLRWRSAVLGNERPLWLYQPAAPAGSSAFALRPLVVLLDGHYWARQLPLFAELDQQTLCGTLPSALYLFVDALGAEQRGRELPCNEIFWRALLDEQLMALAERHGIDPDPRRRIVAGQSYGGLAAVYAALRFGDQFGRALSQSGSFWWPSPAETGAGGWLTQQLLAGYGRQFQSGARRVQLEVGVLESDLLGVNRAMYEALRHAGHSVDYAEVPGGHDWLCWRLRLLPALARLLAD